MIKRILKNRIFLSGVCLFFAGIISFVILPKIYKNQEALTEIITPNMNIPKGTYITENMLTTSQIGAYGLPTNLIQEKQDIVGKYASIDIQKGDYILNTKVQEFKIQEYLDQVIEEDKRLVTITLPSIASGLSSHLEKGDIVSVANFIPEKEKATIDGMRYEQSQVIIYEELKEVEVYDIENSRTESVQEVKENNETSDVSYDPIPKTVTLIINEDQAKKLIEAEYNGKLHLIFVRRNIK